MGFARQHIGQKLPEQKQNQSDVRQPDADFFPGELEAFEVSGNQVDQKQSPDRVARREDRYFPGRAFRTPVNEETPEEFILGLIQSKVHLRDSSDKNQHDSYTEEND